jgi:alpha-beta hydrolase superfamily lysophospholipase
MPVRIKGLALLSGPHDTYVNADKAKKTLANRAPGFKIVQFPGALHEIDNEVPAISGPAQDDILSFIQTP